MIVIDPTLRLYLTIGVISLIFLYYLPIALRVWNDTRQGVEPETDTPEDLLTPLAEAFHSGQMSEEEYNRIRLSVEKVVKPSETLDFLAPRRSVSPKPPALRLNPQEVANPVDAEETEPPPVSE